MDYGRLTSESFSIAWRYKSLWFFGLFAVGGLSNFNFDMSDFGGSNRGFFGSQSSFGNYDMDWLAEPGIWIPMLAMALLMILVFGVLHLICTPALIDAVNKIKRGGEYRFGTSFSAGVDHFWRYFGLILLSGLVIFVVIIIMVLMGIIAFVIAKALGVIFILFAIPLFFLFIYAYTSVLSIAQRAMVVRNIGIMDSIREGMILFRKNMGACAIMFLIYMGLSIAFGLVLLVIWLPFGIISFLSDVGWQLKLLVSILVGMPVSIIVGGFTGTGLFNLYTMFYFELVEPSAPSIPAYTPGQPQ